MYNATNTQPKPKLNLKPNSKLNLSLTMIVIGKTFLGYNNVTLLIFVIALSMNTFTAFINLG